ncbi:MAG: gamma-glutamyl-gamma-aminobutyrate hydrolase family protein [Nitrospiraceae bacterium]|nr:gamma-glutamyl-gamma-aminobutyrate hydrolase family protein [Nitrospiraceae bacterium]
MKKVLVLKNTPLEGPGTIEDYLRNGAVPVETVELSKRQKVPDTGGFSHLLMMGGPMAVYEMEKFAFLYAGAELLRDFIRRGKPVLGVCLGAQMLAHVLGAKVYPGGKNETGWYDVNMTPEGMEDAVFKALSVNGAPRAEVFQWHGDTFDLPEGAVRLASSETYPNQAFRWGKNVYALQFHIEVTPAIIAEWFKDEKDLIETRKIFNRSVEVYPAYAKRAEAFYREFFSF